VQLVLSGLGVPDDIMQVPESGQGRAPDIYPGAQRHRRGMIGGDSLWPGMGKTGRLEAITPYLSYAGELS
jgi:hypothetical protein